jgi:hypothetical protein
VSDPTGERQPTEEEMRAALQQELARVRVEQVVTEATVSILNVAVLRSGLVPGAEGEKDLEQVRLGIEAVRALLPLVEEAAGEPAAPIRDALAQLQMAYVRGTEPSSDADDAPPAPEQPPRAEGGPGPAQQSGRLWVPGQ